MASKNFNDWAAGVDDGKSDFVEGFRRPMPGCRPHYVRGYKAGWDASAPKVFRSTRVDRAGGRPAEEGRD
jgi:hypothetical protein